MGFGRFTASVTCLGITACAFAAYLITTTLAPLFVLTLTAGVVLVALWKWAHLPLIVVGVMAVLSGYVLLNRNFATLHIPAGRLPLYVGELLLGCSLVWVAWHWVPRDMRRASGFLLALGAWLLYATLRFLGGGLDYGIDGIRDFALAYYGLFAVVGFVIWPVIPRSRWTTFFALLFGAAIPVAAYVVAFGPFGLPIPSDDPTADNNVGRADVMAVALIGAAMYFLLALRDTRLAWARIAIAGAALALVIPLEVRAASIGVMALLAVFALQRRWMTLLGLVGFPAVGLAVIALAGVQFTGRVGSTATSAADLLNRQLTIFSVVANGQAAEAVASNTLVSSNSAVDTVAFRLIWWNALWHDVTSSTVTTAFGLGFGADLTAPLDFHPGDPNSAPTRSPHNFLMTLFARTGVIGLALWLMAILCWLRTALTAYRAARRAGLHRQSDYVMWLVTYPLALIVVALFGVVLEGPYGAIPCYLFLGMSLRAATDLHERALRAVQPARRAVVPSNVPAAATVA